MPSGKIDITIKADASAFRKAVEMLTMARDEKLPNNEVRLHIYKKSRKGSNK